MANKKRKSRASSAKPGAALRGLTGSDHAALDAFVRGNAWLKSLLCTLARRGVALRRDHPARARTLLEVLSVYPLFKAGRFLFDLLELEDFMIDGEPPGVMPSALNAAALAQLAFFLNQLKSAVDGNASAAAAPRPEIPADVVIGPTDSDLPPLEAGYYLYEDVVLGALVTSGPLLEARDQAR